MADLPPEPALMGLKFAHLAAGFIGGLARSLTRPGGSLARHVGTAMVGTAVAGYGTPVGAVFAARWLADPGLSVASIEGIVGFVLGLTGMSLCEAAIRWVKIWRDGPPPSFKPPST
ncbi:hypothetical protein FO470_05020 [Starkeya sp. 3C]|uniref:Holin n=1 Tax=Ancylobacter moscoviensis TaxID=2597768 RepID=A0ABY3DWS4_9HYPH|nr:hypothetical protein [Ancylobacter moscoviensis]TSJ64622.1 hypothetical protein FO470_05020 [Ancylobacter moscoviensis]